ncbi:radical SAM protein [Caproiciproducens galactitolivorans]|uniref:Radical SAM protein n=1 Tax=Caproiciproducens galactitolivorans TaxID=642589 RepID=A0ABT4BT45_9FIRM|nr:radical SAM protein [Caproiciproducens galactitolivorans]MCY1714069.1 radical SAM protein [Caproiciproducens galactitolivorans]
MTIQHCTLCPRNCGALRTENEGAGFCGMGSNPVVARAALHFWEEPCISGKRGSGTVFFTGCCLKCVFCQNYQISTKKEVGKIISVQELADIFDRLAEQGAHNINLVNPTHFVPAILQALALRKTKLPVVYNSGGYESLETLKVLDGWIDIYLPDFKYADNALAQKYSGASNYVESAKACVLEMARQTGPAVFDREGMMTRGTIVRHLILPGNTRNSIAVLDWLGENLPDGVLVSLMAQYTPCGKAENFPEINRRITAREYQKMQEHLFRLNLDGFVQERKSASRDFIPPFNLEGVSR